MESVLIVGYYLVRGEEGNYNGHSLLLDMFGSKSDRSQWNESNSIFIDPTPQSTQVDAFSTPGTSLLVFFEATIPTYMLLHL